MAFALEGKVVVITGGSKGIGCQLVDSFAREHGIVYFTYLNSKEAAMSIEEKLCAEGLSVKACYVDGSSSEQVQTFISEIIAKHGRVDILINNAGYIPQALFFNTNEKVWNRTFLYNTYGVYHYCSAVLKHMVLKREGVIINISSAAAYKPKLGQSAYSSSKAAIESLTKVLALEYGQYNIRINTIAPGYVQTETAKSIKDKTRNRIIENTPLRRFVETEDIANAALFLSSELAKNITGIQMLVTAGRHLTL